MAVGAGARVLRRLGLDEASLAERFTYSLAIGLGCVAYGVLALGLTRLLWAWPALALVVAMGAFGAREAAALARDALAALRRSKGGGSGVSLVMGAVLALLLAGTLVAAMAPPSGNDWDGLAYHLADPAIYLRHRGIVPLFWETHSNFPFTVEMLYALALLAKSPAAARAVHWLYLLLTCLFLAGAWRRLWPDAPAGARWVAPLLLVASPIVLWSATVAYNDLALMAYEALALYGVWRWARGGGAGWLWAGGLCLGLALGTKMTALAQAALLAPLVVVAGVRAGSGLRGAVGRAAAWGGIAAGVGAPWYIKSYVHTGNPVYPFFYRLFPNTRYWNAENAADYASTQAAFGMGHGWPHLLAAPWDLVAHAERFTDGAARFAILVGGMGPAFLALAPAALLLRRRDAVAASLLGFSAAYLLLWFHLSQQTRYLMPIFPLWALAGARALCGLLAERRMARFPALGAVAAQVGMAAILAGVLAADALPVVAGREQPRDYLRRTLDVYPVCERINEELPREARLLLIHEVRGFYLERDYLWGNQGHHTAIPWRQFRDEREMRRFLRRNMGVTHVLINHRVGPRDQQPTGWERTLWEAIHKETLAPLLMENGFWVYAVSES